MSEHSAFTQLVSVGVLWIAFHCAGMCGPIVCGAVGGSARSLPAAIWGLLQYQLGRAVGLGVMGAIVGGVGGAAGAIAGYGTGQGGLELVGGVFALAMAAVLLIGALHDTRARPSVLVQIRHQHGRGVAARVDRAVVAVADAIGRVAQRLRGRPALLGLTLSLLPCMIVVWALSLAATTASALAGAQVMVLLVAMTTVPLFFAVVGVRGVFKLLPWPWLGKVPPLVSGLWLVAVCLASLGVIEHVHVVVYVFGPRTVMLW